MTISRRQYLAAVAALPIAPRLGAAAAGPAGLLEPSAFAATDIAYFDNGSQHPMPLAGKAAVEAYLAKRTLAPAAQAYQLDEEGPLAKFARLINADTDEVTRVQSTTAGEQMVLRALDMPAAGGHIVTDTLHFFGSLPLYEEMARQGMAVTWLKPVDGCIRIDDMRAAVRGGTKLVALSRGGQGAADDLRQPLPPDAVGAERRGRRRPVPGRAAARLKRQACHRPHAPLAGALHQESGRRPAPTCIPARWCLPHG